MKNYLQKLGIMFLVGFLMVASLAPLLASAADYGLEKTQQATNGLLPTTIGGAHTVPELIGVVITTVLGFLGIVFFLIIFYAGLVWMTARGDEGKIESSKESIIAAVTGLVIIMAAYAITRFVFTSLGANGGATVSTPVTAPVTTPPPNTALGCCVNNSDTSKCTANRLEANCVTGETWAPACPGTCALGPPAP